jgi:multiple sugar transport system substrate-binding protein
MKIIMKIIKAKIIEIIKITSICHLDKLLFMLAIIVFLIGSTVRFGKKKVIEAKKPVTLVFSQWWQDELEQNTLSAIIAEFEKINPGIKIQLDNRSYHEMENMILNGLNDKIAGFTENFLSADILALDPRWLYGLIQNDMLEPLAPYMQKSEFIPALQTDGQERVYDEWAFPLVSFMAPLFYNIEVLKDAGFDRPPKNWSDFLHYARTITDKDAGRFGTALSLSQGDPQGVYVDIYSWIWASGTVILNQGKPNFTALSVIETLEFLDNLYMEGLIAPDIFLKSREQKLEEFITGKLGMMIASVQDIEIVRERMGDAGFGITTIPGPDVYLGKPAFGLTNWYASISRESKHKDKAWAFISFLAMKSPFLAAASHAVPGSGNGLEDYLKGDSFYSKAYNIYEGGDGIQEFAGYPAVHVLDFIVREELYNMLEWRQDSQATAEAIQRRWEEVFHNALRFGS